MINNRKCVINYRLLEYHIKRMQCTKMAHKLLLFFFILAHTALGHIWQYEYCIVYDILFFYKLNKTKHHGLNFSFLIMKP